MFENTIRALYQVGATRQLSVPIELDDERYYDRQCPNPECGERFKVQFDDWKAKAGVAAYCPACRVESSESWSTPEQQAYLQQYAHNHVRKQLHGGLMRDARQQNSRPQTGLVRATLQFRPGTLPPAVPPEAAAVLQQKYTCEECECRYASRGVAFFCPACGHNSVVSTFQDTVNGVRKTVLALPGVKETMPDPDTARDFERYALESSLVKLVGAFQRVNETLFERLPNAGAVKRGRNAFQNLSLSSDLWKQQTGRGYEDLVSAAELATLARIFQQRHLLAHREGIVDREYLDKTGDTSYAVGQRLVVREQPVLQLADGVQSLATQLMALV